MRMLVRRFIFDRYGALVAEFAAAMPVLIVLLLAGVEVSRFALLHQKLDRLATTMSDLVAREEKLTVSDIDQMFLIAGHVAWPFDMMTRGVVIVSAISVPAPPPNAQPGPPVVNWQRRGGGALDATSAIGAAAGPAHLPAGLQVAPNQTVIVAEVFFDFRPLFVAAIVPTQRLYHRAFYRPRLGALNTLD